MESDVDLVRRSLAGETIAFGDLYARHMAAVAAHLRRALPGAHLDFADTVQDAFVRAWCRLPPLRDPARFGAWVRAIAVAAAHDRLRATAREVPVGEPPDAGRPGPCGLRRQRRGIRRAPRRRPDPLGGAPGARRRPPRRPAPATDELPDGKVGRGGLLARPGGAGHGVRARRLRRVRPRPRGPDAGSPPRRALGQSPPRGHDGAHRPGGCRIRRGAQPVRPGGVAGSARRPHPRGQRHHGLRRGALERVPGRLGAPEWQQPAHHLAPVGRGQGPGAPPA